MTNQDGYQPGAIVADSWGYDQTNVDFYRIERRTPAGFLVLQPLEGIEAPDAPRTPGGPPTMTGTVTPGSDKGKTIRRRLCFRDSEPIGFAINNYSGGGWCQLWSEDERHVSHYA